MKMNFRRSSFLVLFSLLCSSACEQSVNDTQQKETFSVALNEVVTSVDPAQAATVDSGYLVVNLYDTLYSYKYLTRPYELKPRLASSMPTISQDGLVYTIALKENVHFVDDPSFADGKGREVTASDVIYSIKRHFDPEARSQGVWLWTDKIEGLDDWAAQGADYNRDVSGLRALDDHSVQVTLTRPYPQFVHTLALGFAAIIPREAVETYKSEFAQHPVGSGPYRLESINTTHAELVRNPDYRKEPIDLEKEGYQPELHASLGLASIEGRSPPLLDKIAVEFIPDHAAKMVSLMKGNEVQLSPLPSAHFDQYLAGTDPVQLTDSIAQRMHVSAAPESGLVFRAFNMSDPDFGDGDSAEQSDRNKALRCAIIKGFNWRARIDAQYSGVGTVFPGIIPPTVPEFDPELSRDSVALDIEGARLLLQRNGWTADNLPQLTYGIPASVQQTQMFEQFRGFMTEIGYPAEKIVLKRYATLTDITRAWKNRELPLVNKGWGLDYPDAENTLQLFYGPNSSPGSNDGNYNNPEYDRLFRKASVLPPGDERTRLYRMANQLVIEDCAAITGLSRLNVDIWYKDWIVLPDRSFVGGYYLPFVSRRSQ